MIRLPHWVLTDKFPALYDTESATVIEQTAKVYGAMNKLIDEYNNFVDNANGIIENFETSTNKDIELFKVSMRQEFQDFIDVAELKMEAHVNEVADMVEFIKTQVSVTVASVIEEMRENGELSTEILEAFNAFDIELSAISERFDNISEDVSTTNERIDNVITDVNESISNINGRLATFTNDINGMVNLRVSTIGGFEAMSDGIASKWATIANGNGVIRLTDDSTMYHGTYHKYSDTLGSIHMTSITGDCNTYVWHINGEEHGIEKLTRVSELENYLPKTGGTVNGNIIADGGENGIYMSAQNNLAEIRLFTTSAGDGGVYDMKHSKWIAKSDTNGNVTVNGTASGNIPISGGVATGTIGVERSDSTETIVMVKNSKGHMDLFVSENGYKGLIDRTNGKWVVQTSPTGTTTFTGTASGNLTASDFTVNGDTLILNFL